LENNKKITFVIKKLESIIKYHKISNAIALKEYIYTHNFSEEIMKQLKDIFNEYGEINVFNSVLSYCNIKKENTLGNLIKKIKGIK